MLCVFRCGLVGGHVNHRPAVNPQDDLALHGFVLAGVGSLELARPLEVVEPLGEPILFVLVGAKPAVCGLVASQ